jgi:antitoxin (DNA-binding transcriptional repressor) of toxin-antitoxin stability system
MKKASVADLRNKFSQVSEWLEQGEEVEILRYGKKFATLSPFTSQKAPPVWPDFAKRAKKVGLLEKRVNLTKILLDARGER